MKAPSIGRFIEWHQPPRRGDLLNAYGMVNAIQPNMNVVRRVVEEKATWKALVAMLRDRRQSSQPLSRYEEEAYLLTYERSRWESGQPGLGTNDHLELRREGLGLNVENELAYTRMQTIARFHGRAPSTWPRTVELIVAGLSDLRGGLLEEAVAELLADDKLYLRRDKYPADKHPDFRYAVVRQWAEAVGATTADQMNLVERLIERDRSRRMAAPPAEQFTSLNPSMLVFARQVVSPADSRLTYYFWRCLSRIAAREQNGRVMWRSQWLLSAKNDPNAIPGVSGVRQQLKALLDAHVWTKAKGHSGGAAGYGTEYLLKIPVTKGSMTFKQVAKELEIEVDEKGKPKK